MGFYLNKLDLYLTLFITKLVKMVVENMEEEGLIKNPNLDIAQLAFLLQNDKENSDLRSQLIFHVQKNDMSPYYKSICAKLVTGRNVCHTSAKHMIKLLLLANA